MPKLKAVMFTDQVKFTEATQKRTHAQISQVARDQEELTLEVLSLSSGTLHKDTGDGHLTEFPSVMNAVQAGMLLQKRVAGRNAAQQGHRLKFELHVGIDAGEIVVLENGDLRGDAVNRCARVCSECPPGEVYLSGIAAELVKGQDVELEKVGDFSLKGIGKTDLHRVTKLHVWPTGAPNPFIWRGGITKAEDFFGREREKHTLRTYLQGRQSCQIVGPRRIGKTSLLRLIERAASGWDEKAVPAYLDLQDPRCFTLAGWLSLAGRRWNWTPPATTLAEFSERVDLMSSGGHRPVLCLDEFEELTSRRAEFTRDFYATLRSCAQRAEGMSVITASRKPLSELTEHGDPASPFYNTLPPLRLGPFNNLDAQDFVNLHRPGIQPFTLSEKNAILSFAKDHPLALQLACFQVLETKLRGESLADAMRKASDDMKAHLPDGW